MLDRSSMSALVLMATLCVTWAGAPAAADGKYPNWEGQWRRAEGGSNRFDTSKPSGPAQQAPLTPEYRAIYEASLADQAAGGQGTDPVYRCIPAGMPRQMATGLPMEFIVSPKVTHILYDLSVATTRRIYTDGRDWPKDEEPTFAGYSIGKWIDTDGDGRYDVLEVETRNLKGPRVFDNTGTPMHKDNATIVNERFYSDKADPDRLHLEITTIDNALTRPWAVKKAYRREKKVLWAETNCSENNQHVEIGGENYFLSADGYLMPTRKDQLPPDLRYFPKASK